MINFIVGENSCGKTMHLQEKVKSLGISNCITNIEELMNPQKIEIDWNKIEILRFWTPFNIEYNGEEVFIPNLRVDREFTKFIKDICSCVPNMIYDEPERKIGYTLHPHVYDIMNRLSKEFEEFWITSHSQYCTSLMDARYFTCKDKYNLVEISEEEADEILDYI